VVRAATAALLGAGGVVVLLYAARLGAAALGWGFSPLDSLPLPDGHAVRAAWLVAAVAALAALVWLVARHGEPTLWLNTPEGGIEVRASALEQQATRDAEADAEVVCAHADLHVARGVLKANVRVLGRPLGDAARLGAETEARVRAGLVAATGLADVRVRVRPRILAVRQLARYLP